MRGSVFTSRLQVLGLLATLICCMNLQAQVGIGTNSPGDGSVVDTESSTKGVLIPRVSIADLSTIAPITVSGTGEESLLVYNTNTTTGKGFYYWDGDDWILIGSNVASGDDWQILGNAGTDITSDFLGTIDDQDYIFRTHGIERMRLTYNTMTGESYLGIGTDTPSERVDVNGDMETGGGAIRSDNQGENIYIRPTRNTWYLSVDNDPVAAGSEWYVGDNPSEEDKAMAIDVTTGNVTIGGEDDPPPPGEDLLHIILDDRTENAVMRIDNDNGSIASTVHQAFELWAGPTQKGFFRHKNVENELEIGHGEDTGEIDFYLGTDHIMNLSAPGGVRATSITNNLTVNGTLSKLGGTFKIDHPVDPENKYLYHSFVESPDMMNIYDGIITTDDAGMATIQMPSYFDALNKDFQYQFTPIGAFSKVMVTKEIDGNQFVIKSQVPNVKISWQVTGIRKDPYANKYRVIPEVDKEPTMVGSYLYPESKTVIPSGNVTDTGSQK